jgi:hypothetical protein
MVKASDLMKKLYRILSAILAAVMILLSGCEISETNSEVPLIPKFFLEKQTVANDNLPENFLLYNDIFARGDGYITAFSAVDEDNINDIRAIKIYDDNTIENPLSAPAIPYKVYIALFATETGFTAVSLDFDEISPGVIFDSYDKDFNLITSSRTDFDFSSFGKIVYDGTDYYISTHNGNFDFSLRRFGSDFAFIDEPYRESDSSGQSDIRGFTLGSDGKVYVVYDLFGDSYRTFAVPYSAEKNDTSLTEIVDEKRSYSYFPGEGKYLFFGADNSYIYGYKADGDIDMIMPVSDFDIPYENIITGAEINGEKRTSFYQDYDTGEIIRYDFTLKIPKKDDRTVLKLSVNYADGQVINTVSAFNRISTKYRVEIDETGDRDNPLFAAFDKAILDDSLGDIIIAPEYANVNYTEKGIYCDLYEFMDNDESFNREMFLPHILEALETDGKLLRLWSSFGIETYLASDTALPPTYDNISKIFAENPEKIILSVYPNDAAAVFTALLQKNAGYFSEPENLDSAVMRKALEFSKNYAEKPISEEDYYTRFAKGKGYYKSERINDIGGFIAATEIEPAGERYSVPVGNPIPSGEPKIFLYGNDIAINNESENKAGAWEFIKFYVGYREQFFVGFPVLAKDYTIMAEEAAAETVRLKAKNGEDYSSHSVSTGYMSAKVRLPVREDFDAVLALIPGAVVPDNTDKDLLVIITEEAEPYFKGKKSIDETLKVIKNRAGNYIAERQ